MTKSIPARHRSVLDLAIAASVLATSAMSLFALAHQLPAATPLAQAGSAVATARA